MLTQTHIVKGLNPFTPGVNIVFIYLAGSDRIRVEQRQAESLIDVLGSHRVSVDNLLGTDLVGILVVLQVVVIHIGSRIVDPSDLALFTNLNLGHDWVDGGSGVINIGNRPSWRHRL